MVVSYAGTSYGSYSSSAACGIVVVAGVAAADGQSSFASAFTAALSRAVCTTALLKAAKSEGSSSEPRAKQPVRPAKPPQRTASTEADAAVSGVNYENAAAATISRRRCGLSIRVPRASMDYSKSALLASSFVRYSIEVTMAGRTYTCSRNHCDISRLIDKLRAKGAVPPHVALPAVDRFEPVIHHHGRRTQSSDRMDAFSSALLLTSGTLDARSKACSLALARSCSGGGPAADCHGGGHGGCRSSCVSDGDGSSVGGGWGSPLEQSCRTLEAFLRRLFHDFPAVPGHADVHEFFWEPVSPRGSLATVPEVGGNAEEVDQ
ncbi:unnamed protein product [Phaeothamnion confervicola]